MVVVERVEVPVQMEDYLYDNDELYHEENQGDNAQQQVGSGPVVVDPYEDQNYTSDNDYQDENDMDYHVNGPRGMGGHYYTYYDEEGRFVRTNTIRR